MKRICILCLLAALLLSACGLADAPYMEPVRTYCAALQDGDFTRLQEAIPPPCSMRTALMPVSWPMCAIRSPRAAATTMTSRQRSWTAAASPRAAAACSRIISASSMSWIMTVDEARLVKFRVSFTGELDGQLNVRAVCYQTGGHWYLDLSAVNLNLFS